jgi:hypothetical protein
MTRRRFSEEQIQGILQKHEAGALVADLWRKQVSVTQASTNGK